MNHSIFPPIAMGGGTGGDSRPPDTGMPFNRPFIDAIVPGHFAYLLSCANPHHPGTARGVQTKVGVMSGQRETLSPPP